MGVEEEGSGTWIRAAAGGGQQQKAKPSRAELSCAERSEERNMSPAVASFYCALFFLSVIVATTVH